jgi:hypothetical protein
VPHQVEVLAGRPGHHLIAGHPNLGPRAAPQLRLLLKLEHEVGEGRLEVTEIVDRMLGRAGRSLGP